MAKYDVKFSCGHAEEMDLGGKVKDRQRKITYWEQNGLCKACYRQYQAQLAKKSSDNLGLPELTGSEKQVAWALKLRLEWISRKQDTLNRFPKQAVELLKELGREGTVERLKEIGQAKGGTPEQIEGAIVKMADMFTAWEDLRQAETTTSAGWFIDRRFE